MFYLLKGQERLKFLRAVDYSTYDVARHAAIRYFIDHDVALKEFLPDLITDLLQQEKDPTSEEGAMRDTYFKKGLESLRTAEILKDTPCHYARATVAIGSELADAWVEFIGKTIDNEWDDIVAARYQMSAEVAA